MHLILPTSSMVATLVDQPACLPWSIIDYDPHSNSLIPPPSLFVMRLEGQFLDQVFTSFSSELSDPIGVLSTESPWSDFLRTAQQLHVSAGSRHSFLGWALIRVNWLNIIHRAPLVNHPLLAASSWSIIARAASHILRVYYDLAITDSLYPCWVQLRRIVICTQLAVLTCDHGHLHQVEAGELLSIGIELVRRHEIVWETARSTRIGLESARDRLLSSVYGVVVGPQMATVLQDAVSSEATRPMLPIHLHQTDPDQGVVTDITAPSSIDNNVSHGNGTWHSGFGDWQELGIDWPELWTGAMSDMKEVTVSGAAAGQLAQVNLDELFGV
ncbi:hypothetical protein BCR39DRAFT_104452 [Naematelia encephala]|uniref:Transcription factor domain-containing protein n=1 Tax=Naematelia encephala TaxID=71784 RepID=A0A1Y2B8D0_9TREE|nr:hypothetical protein BCR39DRAFT_104452 [Naematelia encephala]